MRSSRESDHGRPVLRLVSSLRWVLAGAVAFSCAASAVEARELDAFPGAAGYGRGAQGGRGGRIVEVVNLADSGPGSLRACVLQTGPRNCTFRVSGVIVLQQSLLVQGMDAGNLSILGQTAPGDGITLTVEPESKSRYRTTLVVKNTHDVIVRNIRLRSQAPATVANVDAVTVEGSQRVYIDHVSGSWATDENISTHAQTSDLTIAYSIFGEGLRKHSKCALLGSDPMGPQNISFWRNLCISNNDRNPDVNHFMGSCIEIVDNLFYNARSEWAEVFSQMPGGTPVSFVGNYFKSGPSTLENTHAITWQDVESTAPPAIYASGNAVWTSPGKTLSMLADNTASATVEHPRCPLNVSTLGDAVSAYQEVVKRAGAFPRDRTDLRFAKEIGAPYVVGIGHLQTMPGTIEPIGSGIPYIDADDDGMADSVEERFGAKVGVSDAWETRDGEEWSNFDRFMEWLSEERLAGHYPE